MGAYISEYKIYNLEWIIIMLDEDLVFNSLTDLLVKSDCEMMYNIKFVFGPGSSQILLNI